MTRTSTTKRTSWTSTTRTRTSSISTTKTTKTTSSTTETAAAAARVAIGLGSNLGDRLEHLRCGLRALDELIDDLRVAPLFRTPAMRRSGEPVPPDWPDFLNTAATGLSEQGPEVLLAELKSVELAAGRRRAPRDAPRALDLDLLLYDAVVIDRPELTLPHPGLYDRLFVLEPLAIIAPDWPVPGRSATVAALLESQRGETSIDRLDWPHGDWRIH